MQALRPDPASLTRLLVISLAYFATGWLGLQVPYTGSHITLIWLPTGIAVAALLRWGWGMWPGVYLGAFFVNLAIGSPWPLAAAIAVGNTLGPLLTTGWLKRLDFHPAFDRQRDVGSFVAATCAGMMLSATGGIASLYLTGLMPASATGSAWLTWWMGDSVGVLLAAPVLLTVTRKNLQQLRSVRSELLLWTLVAGTVAWLAFIRDYAQIGRTLPLAFLTLPLFAWAALRFGNTVAAVAGLAFSVVAAWGTTTGHGTFFVPDEQISLFLLWSYMATTVLSGLVIAALQAERLAMKTSLLDSEKKLRGLYELSPLGIALTDMQGHYLEFNEAFRSICGYSAEELKTLDYWALTPKRYAADEARQLESLEHTGRYGPYEKEYIRKDGSRVPLRLNGMLVKRNDGQHHIWSIIENITDLKLNEQRLEHLLASQKAMLENQLVGIVTTRNRTIVWANPAFEKMLGYAPGELAGTPTRRNYPSETAYLAFGAAAYPVLGAGDIFRSQVEHVRKDGRPIWVDVSGAMLNRESGESLWCFIDVSERRQAEEALRQAKEAAETANAVKSRFLATMSHEIRTPMNGIMGMAQLLQMPGLSEAERNEFVQTILSSGQTLLMLLNDILDLSKVEAGKIELNPTDFDLRQMLFDSINLFTEPAQSKGLHIAAAWHGPAGQHYRADPVRLQQMLSNLLSNAIKFTASGFVHLEAAELERRGNRVVLEFAVTDSGIGIPADKHPLLFKPFSQLDSSTTREYGGTGLGLSIVSSLAKLMDGELGVDSEPGRGSRFWFRIPAELPLDAASRPADAAQREIGTIPELAGYLLVAEDNPCNQKVITALLGKLGVRSECVGNGQQAIDALRQGRRPDLLLMDVQMPVMDGIETTRRIRQWEREIGRDAVPIIALTAGAFEEDRQRCQAAGMDDFLTKPIHAQELTAALVKWMGQKRAI